MKSRRPSRFLGKGHGFNGPFRSVRNTVIVRFLDTEDNSVSGGLDKRMSSGHWIAEPIPNPADRRV